jgi:hypothetical protein
MLVGQMDWLNSYISPDDVELSKDQFLRTVADRINADLAADRQRRFRATHDANGHPNGVPY